MNLKTFCQLLLLVHVVGILLRGLWVDFHGTAARKPYGFQGAITTLTVTAIFILVLWKAGALSNLIGPE